MSSSVKSISGLGGIMLIGHLLGEWAVSFKLFYTPGLVPFLHFLSGT